MVLFVCRSFTPSAGRQAGEGGSERARGRAVGRPEERTRRQSANLNSRARNKTEPINITSESTLGKFHYYPFRSFSSLASQESRSRASGSVSGSRSGSGSGRSIGKGSGSCRSRGKQKLKQAEAEAEAEAGGGGGGKKYFFAEGERGNTHALTEAASVSLIFQPICASPLVKVVARAARVASKQSRGTSQKFPRLQDAGHDGRRATDDIKQLKLRLGKEVRARRINLGC